MNIGQWITPFFVEKEYNFNAETALFVHRADIAHTIWPLDISKWFYNMSRSIFVLKFIEERPLPYGGN